MKFLNIVDFQTLEIIDLPRNMYRVRIASNPARAKVILTMAVIVGISLAYAVFS